MVVHPGHGNQTGTFLNDKIGFLNMSDLIDNCLEKITFVKSPTIEDYIETDLQTRLLMKNN